jgi:hypothetical protein
MDPTLSGFALGLLFGAAKLGLIGTIVFGIAWWRTRRKLKRLEAELPSPAVLEERLASIEQVTDFTASQMARLIKVQEDLTKQIARPSARSELP